MYYCIKSIISINLLYTYATKQRNIGCIHYDIVLVIDITTKAQMSPAEFNPYFVLQITLCKSKTVDDRTHVKNITSV